MFKDAKVGDRVWDFLYGYGKVLEVDKNELWVEFESLCIDKKRVYIFDGELKGVGYPQTLFWDEIKFEIPKKPFDLEDELKKLEVIKFENGAVNCSLFWDNEYNKIKQNFTNYCQNPFEIFFTEDSLFNFMDNIKDRNITKEEFFKAYNIIFGGKND